ncbi:MAG: hypothetical protein HYY48_12130 [Gammaproteobacteria bacterium]|nr:hypothetical protein [Gammaproteobacteria bacterium]
MEHEIKLIPCIQTRSGIPCLSPDPHSATAVEQDPAIRVMTDFSRIVPITVEPIVGIDLALRKMKDSGVRLLLVTDPHDNIAGVITSYDIQGEKPIKYSEEYGVHHSRITVEQIMTPLERVPVFDYGFVQQSLVRHVINTMKALNRRHALVVETRQDRQLIRGIFSTSQIGKMLGTVIHDPLRAAPSLADMQQERSVY